MNARKAELYESITEGPPWVIVMTKPSAEELAERSLRRAGYRVYLPRYRREMRRNGQARRGTPSMRPLFTGHLFVQDWRGWPAESIAGIIGLLKVADRNAELVDAEIGKIWVREKSGKFDEMPPPGLRRGKRTDLSIGDQVEFELSGQRILAVLDDLTDSGKAVVSAMIFSRATVFRDVVADDLVLVAP